MQTRDPPSVSAYSLVSRQEVRSKLSATSSQRLSFTLSGRSSGSLRKAVNYRMSIIC